VSLGRRRVRTGALRAAVREVLEQPRYREQAQRMQYEIAQGDAAQRSATLLEQLAVSGRPVGRVSAHSAMS
jgi:UDP:flavonoid glycosyltransferase YjiC (YdhE family)